MDLFMKIWAFNMDEKDLPEEWKALLEMGKDSDGEEVFVCMMDDLLYLAALVDLQSDFMRIAKLRGGILPEGFDTFPEEVRHLADETLAKWEIYAQPTV